MTLPCIITQLNNDQLTNYNCIVVSKFNMKMLYSHKCMRLNQESKGIRQWPINLCTSPMMIHKITPSLDYNWWFKHLDTQLNESTNQNSRKVAKFVRQTNKKTLF